ncbi:MAG: hypothetical protein methR_P3922 [Methyloprofundus sp.]|nr:MAG: hypothetical protein methR_P3922 [Methyloprofundus sp.]
MALQGNKFMHYQHHITHFSWFLKISLLIACISTNSLAALNDYDRLVDHPPIPILDEQGQHVLLSHNPYSPKKSCAGSGCHDYDKITHAYHFEMGRDEADDNYGAKRGLPHLVSPGYYGGYTCMGGNNQQVLAKKNNANAADFADLGSAGWVKTCMSCHAGGGWAEKDREGIRYDQKNPATIKPLDGDYYERIIDPQTGTESLQLWDWQKSGVGEADCLFCHAKFSKLKLPSDSGLTKALSPRFARGALIEKGFFRQAASGLMEYVKNTDGKHLLSIARNNGEFNLNAQGMPIFNWHADAFNETGRVTIPMLRFPESDNCMECHLTSNTRRGFYGFGEEAKATLATEGGDEEAGAGSTLEDDYRDDIHKGTNYTADNGEKRSIESCNACHSSQYYKPNDANIDLDANHDFPKGNSDMDVRNDLDYNPNVKSCEQCHINSINAVVGIKYDSLLHAHTERWKKNGDLNGYEAASHTPITQTHFDIVSCQTCHIVNKNDKDGKKLQMMYRFRIAKDGQAKISPYNPRVRYYWQDKTSGKILVQTERNAIFAKVPGTAQANIIDPMSQAVLGQVSTSTDSSSIVTFNTPGDYENTVAVKTAYDSLLRQKGYSNPNTTLVWSESNEYVISHNTRAAKDAMPCLECHARTPSGTVSQLIDDQGTLGTKNSKTLTIISDQRLVDEGIITIGLSYTKLQSGALSQNVADILQVTKADPFMSLLKNSSASEIIGEFTKISTNALFQAIGSEFSSLVSSELTEANSFFFGSNKGAVNLRSMGAIVSGGAVNDIILPTYRAALGILNGAESSVQDYLNTHAYGQLRSRVFYLNILDDSKKPVTAFNGKTMLVSVAYKGNKTDLNDINVIFADTKVTKVIPLSLADLVAIKPADAIDDGFVLIKIREPGYFLITDK